MTRRNDKRNNRRNRQRNNNSELNPFAQMLFGALLGKGAGMIADTLMKKAEEKTEEKTEDKPHTGIRQSDNLLESSCIIKGDGSATEIPIPDGFQIFINEDGKPMIRKKIEGDEKKTPDDKEGKPITYDDICKDLFYNKDAYYLDNDNKISSWAMTSSNYKDFDNCTSIAQAKRMIAFNKLQNIAKYLNGDWKPRFDGNNKNWLICIEDEGYNTRYNKWFNYGSIFFKTEETAYEAIRLMGEDSLNDLFSTDW